MRSIFWLAFGLGIGLLVGAAVVRRLNRAGEALDPARLAGGAGRGVGALADRLTQALEQGREAADEREAELRADHDVPGVRETLGGSDRA